MSSTPVLCSVAAEAFGTPPRRSRIEARKLPQGFEVWFFDEHSCPDGQRLAQRESPYSARAFARVMLDFGIDRRLYGADGADLAPHTSWSAAVVTGERGLRAQLLRVAYTTGSRYIYWLMAQSDASFEFLETLFSDPLDDDWDRPYLIHKIVGPASILGYDKDYLDLLQHYGLPADAAGVQNLSAAMSADAERLRQEQEAERQARIAPFRREIDAMAALSSDERWRWAPSPRQRIRWFMEKYVVEHGRMPTGVISFCYESGSWRGPADDNVDFDDLAARAKTPHSEREES